MRIGYLTLITLLNWAVVLGQNLIINPSFEQYEECPESFNTKYKKNLLIGWTSPTSGTPDYFNKCSKGTASIPENWAGFCDPLDGKAYMGFYLFKEAYYREFIQGTFSKPLILGKSYRLSFYVSHSINAEYFTKSIGCLLSSTPVSNYFEDGYSFSTSETKEQTKDSPTKKNKGKSTFIDPMNINTNEGQYFQFQLDTDLVDWQLIELDFVAQNEATNIIVGNFDEISDIHFITNESRFMNEAMLDRSSYAFIDNFSLTPVDGIISDTITTPVTFIMNDFNFEFASAKLKNSAMTLLDSLHHHFLSSNTINILISGHTDDIGSDFFNDQLSRSRAENVSDYLISIGLDPNRVSTIGKGKTDPLKENDSEESRSLNRRVEIQFLK